MSREIKFRGKSALTGKWAYGSYFKTNFCESGAVIAGSSGFGHVEVSPESVGQYIGLKDIDGNEIFQDDICEVMYYTPFGDKTNDFYGKWVVTKWMGQFVLVSGKERVGFTNFSDVVSSEYVSNLGTVCELSETVNVRVIGSINQNPELLK